MTSPDKIEIPMPKDLFSFEPVTQEQLRDAWERMIKPALQQSKDAGRNPSRPLRAVMAVLSAVEPCLPEG